MINEEKTQISKPISNKDINLGGRKPKNHWEDMWVDITAQLYDGRLQPKSQADLVRAMQLWHDEKGIDIGDTSLTERARKLWKKIGD